MAAAQRTERLPAMAGIVTAPERQALGRGDVGAGAAPVGRAQVPRRQPAVFESADQAGRGAPAEQHRDGDLLHLQVPARRRADD
jgi:hypothetical protein